MKLFDEYIDAEDIKAEAIVSQLELPQFVVRNKGIFHRNYSDDLISIKEESNIPIIELSRDGTFHLLPEGLFFKESRLKINDRHILDKENDKIREEKAKIELFFQPFETKYFQLSLELESQLNKIAEKGNSILADYLFEGIDIDSENSFIQTLYPLLPYVSELKGNMNLLRDLLQIIFLAKVEIRRNELSLFFIIHRSKLLKSMYSSLDNELACFFEFFTEWFLPVEVDFDFRIKDYKENFCLGSPLLLDYNTHFYL
ncbi:MAG: hypothetical protein ACK5M3_13075 [Dysgonomonas sp.]